MHVCVCERERVSGRMSKGEAWKKERVCACVCERERERVGEERARERECAKERVCAHTCEREIREKENR